MLGYFLFSWGLSICIRSDGEMLLGYFRVHIPKKSTKDDKKKLNLPYNMYAIKFNPILSLKRLKTYEKILLIFFSSPVTFQDVYHMLPFRQAVFRENFKI